MSEPRGGVRTPRSVIVAGGGLAGIACALRLADHGVRVTLVESRKRLGGRATSFTDPRTGETLDNCQHVVLGCCRNYLRLCTRLGVRDCIHFEARQTWIEAGGRRSTIQPGALPAPSHYLGAFLNAAFLTSQEKWAIASIMPALGLCDRSNHEHETFGAWLARHDMPEGAIRKFWAPVVVSACNLNVDRVSAASAIHVFQEGMLDHRDAAAIGLATVPLVRLYDAAPSAIFASGGTLLLGESVEEVDARSVRLANGRELAADAVVCALPFERALKAASGALRAREERWTRMEGLTHSPILGVHLAFDTPVLDVPHAVLVDRPTQWLFRKDADGSRVHAVISAADDWMPLEEEEIVARVLGDIGACIPSAARARLLSARSVKERRATFAPTPGAEACRPDPLPLGAQPGEAVVLASDAVRTGWPATMEGAVRSGEMAAACVLGRAPDAFLCPGLPVAAPVRWLRALNR